jgi:hypothetical protein
MSPHDERIRSAMTRLLAGEPSNSSGSLTVTSLAEECSLSRQDVYRSGLVDEWKDRCKQLLEGGVTNHAHLARIVELEARLADFKRKASRYRVERDEEKERARALANRVVLLDLEVQSLLQRLNDANKVTTLRNPQEAPEAA